MNVCVLPLQDVLPPTKLGVIVIVELIGVVVVFVAVKEVIFPFPFNPNPMELFVFVQLYEVAFPEKMTVEDKFPLQITWSAG